jgi:hypothetical protein
VPASKSVVVLGKVLIAHVVRLESEYPSKETNTTTVEPVRWQAQANDPAEARLGASETVSVIAETTGETGDQVRLFWGTQPAPRLR